MLSFFWGEVGYAGDIVVDFVNEGFKQLGTNGSKSVGTNRNPVIAAYRGEEAAFTGHERFIRIVEMVGLEIATFDRHPNIFGDP